MTIQTSSVFAEKLQQRLGTEPQFGVVLYTSLDWNIDDGFSTDIPASDFDNDGNFFEIVTMSSVSFKALEGEQADGGGKVTVTLDDSDGKLKSRRNYSIVGTGNYTALLIMYYDKDLAFAEIGTNPSGDDAEHFMILFGGSPMLPLVWDDSLSQVSLDIVSSTSTALSLNTHSLWTDSDTDQSGLPFPGYYNTWANIDAPICFGVPVKKSWTKKLTNSKVGTNLTGYKPILAEEIDTLMEKGAGAMIDLIANYGSGSLTFLVYWRSAFSPTSWIPIISVVPANDIQNIGDSGGSLNDFTTYYNNLLLRAGSESDTLRALGAQALAMQIAVEGPGGYAVIGGKVKIDGLWYHEGTSHSLETGSFSRLDNILAGNYITAATYIPDSGEITQLNGTEYWTGTVGGSGSYVPELSTTTEFTDAKESLWEQLSGFNLEEIRVRLHAQEPVIKSGDYGETSYIRDELATTDITEIYVGQYKLTGTFGTLVGSDGAVAFTVTGAEYLGSLADQKELTSNVTAYNASYPYDIYIMDRYTQASYPAAVHTAYAYRTVKGVRNIAQIPNSVLLAQLINLADESGSDNLAYGLYVNRWKLDTTEEGWEDDIFVDIDGSFAKLYDSTDTPMLLAGIAYIKCLNPTSWNALMDVYPKDPTGYTISSIADYDELYKDLAFQARVGLWTRENSNLKFKYLSKEPEYDYFKDQSDPITINYGTIIRGSLTFTSSAQEDIITDLRFEWRDNGTQEDPNQIIIKQNQFTDTTVTEPMNLPTNTEEYDLWAIDNEVVAKKTSVFWAIRKGYPWVMVRCSVPFSFMEIDLYDTVKVDLSEFLTQSDDAQIWASGLTEGHPWYPWRAEIADLYTSPVKGVIHGVDIDAENRKIDLTIWLPILVGTNQKWGLAWPS